LNKPINYLIVGSILVLFYAIAGHSYVKFYISGKAELLDLATSINQLCNTNKSCPEILKGWQASSGSSGNLRKGNMYYFPVTREGTEKTADNKKYYEFTLVYGFFAPDHWFEVKGGVGRNVTSGWKNSDTSP